MNRLPLARRRRAASVLLLAAISGGCSPRAQVAGKYTHARDPEEWVELRADGGYVAERAGSRTAGSWELAGGRIVLKPAFGALAQAQLEGRFLVAEGNDRWVRKWPAGHYAHPRVSGYFVDLRPDGSYHFARGQNDHRGRYDVAGGTLTLWYPSDGGCTTGGEGPAVPTPGLCAFRVEMRDDRLTFFRSKGEPGKETRELGEEFVLRSRVE